MQQVGALRPGPWNDDLKSIEAVYLRSGGEFLVGTVDGEVVAMGGLRRIDAARAEIKRMRVDPAHQRRGYGRAVLLALEARAHELGYSVLRLDTSIHQTVAVHLYRGHGYIQTGTGRFQDLDVLFFEKQLGTSRTGWDRFAAGRG